VQRNRRRGSEIANNQVVLLRRTASTVWNSIDELRHQGGKPQQEPWRLDRGNERKMAAAVDGGDCSERATSRKEGDAQSWVDIGVFSTKLCAVRWDSTKGKLGHSIWLSTKDRGLGLTCGMQHAKQGKGKPKANVTSTGGKRASTCVLKCNIQGARICSKNRELQSGLFRKFGTFRRSDLQ